VDADYHGEWTNIFLGKASEPENSRPVEKQFLPPHLHFLEPQLVVIPSEFCRDLLQHNTDSTDYLTISGFTSLNGLICLHSVLDKAGSQSVFKRT